MEKFAKIVFSLLLQTFYLSVTKIATKLINYLQFTISLFILYW